MFPWVDYSEQLYGVFVCKVVLITTDGALDGALEGVWNLFEVAVQTVS